MHLVETETSSERETTQARGDLSYQEYARTYIVGTPEIVRERLQPYLDAGMEYFIVTIPRNAYDHAMQNRFVREVVPLFQ